jgi:hypothetical protein
MNKKELEKLVSMSQDEFMQENPTYEPMFPKGWDDDKHWPDLSKNDYDSFRSTQIAIDDFQERLMGCYDQE